MAIGKLLKSRKVEKVTRPATPFKGVCVSKGVDQPKLFVQPPYMSEQILYESYQRCTPLSSFTPSTTKYKKFLNFHLERAQEKAKGPVRNVYDRLAEEELIRKEKDKRGIEPTNISAIYDRIMENIEKHPHKLVSEMEITNGIGVRIGRGTVVRVDGTLLIYFQGFCRKLISSNLGEIGPIKERAMKAGLNAAAKETHKFNQFKAYVVNFAEVCYSGLAKPVIPDRKSRTIISSH